MNPKKVIEVNRAKVDTLTYYIIKLLSERDVAVRKITKAKKQLGLPMIVPQREKELIKKSRIIAKKLGADPKVVEKIMVILIHHGRGLS